MDQSTRANLEWKIRPEGLPFERGVTINLGKSIPAELKKCKKLTISFPWFRSSDYRVHAKSAFLGNSNEVERQTIGT